jgi:hypothetical protein
MSKINERWKVKGDWMIVDCTPAENLIGSFEHIDQHPEKTYRNAALLSKAPELYNALLMARNNMTNNLVDVDGCGNNFKKAKEIIDDLLDEIDIY